MRATDRATGTAIVTLPADDQILITRELDAPPRLVWRAWTTPDLISRWWTAGHGEAVVTEVDLRVGGSWRYVLVTPGGFEVGFHGVYREIAPPGRLVNTEVYEGMPDGEALVTTTFADLGDGRTLLTSLVQHSCREHRDAHIESGMESGLQTALDLLDEIAISLG